jgi:two-component system response regulator DesR
MAVTASSSTPAVGTLTVGVCAPSDFPEAAIRAVLDDAGHSLAFWNEDQDEAIEACREKTIELLLLGARKADIRALKSVAELAEACEATKVILICEQSGHGNVRKALDAGVRGLVALDEVNEALPPVINVVRAGQISVPSSRGAELRKQILTAREKQILGLVVMGMTNAEIAGKLFLAESTVKSHLSSAFAKLGVASRSEAASVILDSKSGLGLGILTIPSN